MDVYKDIVNNIKESFLAEGNEKTANKTLTIMNRYFALMLEGYFNRLSFVERQGLTFSTKIYSMEYISFSLGKFIPFSKLYPYHYFRIIMKWNLLRKNGFKFKTTRKFNKLFKRDVLDTEQIHVILKAHEKTII